MWDKKVPFRTVPFGLQLQIGADNVSGDQMLISDTQMEHTISYVTNRDILIQAGQMMLAQSNQTREEILRLLQ